MDTVTQHESPSRPCHTVSYKRVFHVFVSMQRWGSMPWHLWKLEDSFEEVGLFCHLMMARLGGRHLSLLSEPSFLLSKLFFYAD